MPPSARLRGSSLVILCLAIAATGSVASAEIVTRYDFTGNEGNEEFQQPFFTATGISVSNLTRGGGLTRDLLAAPVLADSFVARNWAGIEPGDFFIFTVTPLDGYIVELTSFQFGIFGELAGPTSVAIRWSLDNFGGDLGTAPVTSSFTNQTIDLSGSPLSFSTPVEFRIFGLGATNNGAALALTSADGTAGLVLNGAVVPEPASWLLLAGVGAAAAALRVTRRRTRVS